MTPERLWANLLLDGFYALSLCVGAMFFLATQRATSARWSAGLRRIPEAFMCAIPVFALLMIPLIVSEGARMTLFPWSRPGAFAHASAIDGKAHYLRTPFVWRASPSCSRSGCVFAWAFRRASLAQDKAPGAALRAPSPRPPGRRVHRRLRAHDHAGRMRLAGVAGSGLVEHDVRGLRLRGHCSCGASPPSRWRRSC